MKKFAVSITLTKHDVGRVHTATRLYLKTAVSEDEAKGASISEAMATEPGFSVGIVLAMEISPVWVNGGTTEETQPQEQDV